MKLEKAKIGNMDVLLVDGVPQSASGIPMGGYWKHMIPGDFKGDRVLILGVAGGTIPRLLLKKYPNVRITGVDNNPTLIMAATNSFNLGEIKMEIKIRDGFEYIKETKKKFDLIIVDIWNGYWFPFKVLTPDFIKDCKRILNKEGQVYINTPSLDYLAKEALTGLNAYRDDIGRNIIYRWEK